MYTTLLPPANAVWGKVIFLHQFVILFTGGEYLTKYTPGTRYSPWTRQVHPPDQAGTPQDQAGTHSPRTRQVHPRRPGRYTPWDQVHLTGPGTPPGTRQVHPPGPGRYTPADQVGTPPGTRYTWLDQVHPQGPGRYTPRTRQVYPPDQAGTPPWTRQVHPPDHAGTPPGTRYTPPRTRYTPRPGRYTPWTRQVQPPNGTRQVHPPGTRQVPPRDQAGTPPGPGRYTPPGSTFWHMVNVRVVRILLECILVFTSVWHSFCRGGCLPPWRGVCIQGGFGQTPPPPPSTIGYGKTSGRYASYWNAFLFCNNSSLVTTDSSQLLP